MSATKPTKPSNKESAGSQEANEKKHQVPTLGALDEDDEFEEFEADGSYMLHKYTYALSQQTGQTKTLLLERITLVTNLQVLPESLLI